MTTGIMPCGRHIRIAVISAMYYDRGYLSVSIHTPRVMLTPDRSGIEISITIDEGPRYRIRQFRIYERGPDGEEVNAADGCALTPLVLYSRTTTFETRPVSVALSSTTATR